jgi:hypothetical protein
MGDPLSNLQFHYDQPEFGESFTTHRVRAMSQHGSELGSMLWSGKEIRNIGVTPGQERRGIATAMWHEGHRLAAENPGIPQPKHSKQRTSAGDKWARSVGGRLPRRV